MSFSFKFCKVPLLALNSVSTSPAVSQRGISCACRLVINTLSVKKGSTNKYAVSCGFNKIRTFKEANLDVMLDNWSV